eukprot:TRINITY_DN7106_c1_g1_i2.p1 TRINITY_DN7106_c1_g1~~TRINITY_DN7106_c1_g1_i2.p1  ORF type:complete len:551 (-),score=79.64 TRINITY_DN7106_c1_g1_i2:2099-3751(-)
MTPQSLQALQQQQSPSPTSQSSQSQLTSAQQQQVTMLQQTNAVTQQQLQQQQQAQQILQQVQSQQQPPMTPMPPVPLPQPLSGSQSGTGLNTQSGYMSATAPSGQYSQEQLWELVKGKEALILAQQKKLVHYRAWMSTIHARVQQMNPGIIKNARRLYIGNLPEGYSDEDELREFFANLMTTKGGCTNPGNPILSCKVTPEKSYAFLELRSVEETTNVLAFDGISFKDCYLKIRRPSNYDENSAVMLGPLSPDPTVDSAGLDICRSVVEDSPNKLFVGGLPCDWTEDQVKELLTPQGNLRSFNLVMDKMTGKSKGYAFCEFDEGATDFVIAALNQKKVGNKILTVKRALEGNKPMVSGVLPSTTPSMGLPQQAAPNSGGLSGRVNSVGRINSGMPSVGSGMPTNQFNQAALTSGPLQPSLMVTMMQNPHQLGGGSNSGGNYTMSGILQGGDDAFSPTSNSRFNRQSGGDSSGRGGLEEAANAAMHGGNSGNVALGDGPNMLQRNPNVSNSNNAGIGGGLPSGLNPNNMGGNIPYSMGLINQPPFSSNSVW